jgi:hypothetical protein
MVPVEVTAFGVLAACVILLGVVLAVQILFRPTLPAARGIMVLALVVTVVLAIYAWATTRMP